MTRRLVKPVLIPLALAALAAWSGDRQSAPAPTPAAAPAQRDRLSGEWDWTASMQDADYSGTMTFQFPPSGGVTGLLRVPGVWDATVRTAEVSGDSLRVVWDSPDGEVLLTGAFRTATSFAGTVQLVNVGNWGTMSATRR